MARRRKVPRVVDPQRPRMIQREFWDRVSRENRSMDRATGGARVSVLVPPPMTLERVRAIEPPVVDWLGDPLDPPFEATRRIADMPPLPAHRQRRLNRRKRKSP